jgi:hypothetical protein
MQLRNHCLQILPCLVGGGVIRSKAGQAAVDIDTLPIKGVKGFGQRNYPCPALERICCACSHRRPRR